MLRLTAGGQMRPCSLIHVPIWSELLFEFTPYSEPDAQDPFHMQTVAAPEVCEPAPFESRHSPVM